ncbi:hypothetical protein H6P81_009148 [Aristolochia fimbriata]|uniref:Uncharacterized protein n=1 Tax=Aristolochia fimbriata TaxID=158543 RepID=A0AAV7EK21_ARIFI|nr:hypothetical protein H6P81_009148 [Aristolochia fimbriata]
MSSASIMALRVPQGTDMSIIRDSAVSSTAMAFRVPQGIDRLRIPFSSALAFFEGFLILVHVFLENQQGLRTLQQIPTRIDLASNVKNTSLKLLDAFVDSLFRFEDQPLLPTQSNFAPVDEIGEAVEISCIDGEIPPDFPEGVYIRNGSNPLFGALQSTVSVFGRSSETWFEGEGMVHAVYFAKNLQGKWRLSYKNKYVETETYKIEKERSKPSFLPAIEGDSPAVLAAFLLNQLRYGEVSKCISNTNVFEHSGKCYAVAENDIPQEIDLFSLNRLNEWDVNGAWDRPFTSHPKRAPVTGELVIIGVDTKQPYVVLGVISADGKTLTHRADLELKRCVLSHEIGVTERYNIILDCPLTLNTSRLIKGGPLIKYDEKGYSSIGVMPRYGDAKSVKWFEVETHCIFHVLNCFEDGDEVVVRGCRAQASIIPGPDLGLNKFEWFSRGLKPMDETVDYYPTGSDGFLFSRAYEWKLNMKSGQVKERFLTRTDFSMDFPAINNSYIGLRNKYGYTQVVDSAASSSSGLPKYGKVAKLYFDQKDKRIPELREKGWEDVVKVEYHHLGESEFCSGAVFVGKHGAAVEEDDGWIVSFVHNEETDLSQVHIIDAKKFEGEAVAKISLPHRVPYGFHGTFISSVGPILDSS